MYFSMLQELNVAVHGHNPECMANFEEEKRKAKIHVEFCCTLFMEQLRQGRHFLHGHPWSARSWVLPCMQQLMSHPSVDLVQGHMCQFTMTAHIDKKDGERGLVNQSPQDFFRAADVSDKSSTENAQEAMHMFHWSVVVRQELRFIHRCCARPYVVEWLDNKRRTHQWEVRP